LCMVCDGLGLISLRFVLVLYGFLLVSGWSRCVLSGFVWFENAHRWFHSVLCCFVWIAGGRC
jgi:hypothetical protein